MRKAFKPHAASTRPSRCEGCPLHPSTPTWDRERCGGFAPPTSTGPCGGPGEHAMREMLGAIPIAPTDPIFAIGIAPGEEEERNGEPLVGPSGRLLSSALQWAGHVDAIFKANLVQCRTTEKGLTKTVNRDPTAAEIRACLPRFRTPLLQGYNGTLLLLGALAYKWVTDEAFGPFAEARGHRLTLIRSPHDPIFAVKVKS